MALEIINLRFEIELKDNKEKRILKLKGDDFLEISFIRTDNSATEIKVAPKKGIDIWKYEE